MHASSKKKKKKKSDHQQINTVDRMPSPLNYERCFVMNALLLLPVRISDLQAEQYVDQRGSARRNVL